MNALERFGRYPLYLSTLIAAIIAAIITGIAHLLIGDLLGGIPDGFRVDTPSGEQDLLFTSSMFATFLYVLLGGVVYAIVRRFARDAGRIFVIVAVIGGPLVHSADRNRRADRRQGHADRAAHHRRDRGDTRADRVDAPKDVIPPAGGAQS